MVISPSWFTTIIASGAESNIFRIRLPYFFENAATLKEKEEIIAHLKAISHGLSDTIKHLNEVASMQTDINVNREAVNLRSYIAKTEEILKGEIQAKEGLVINNVAEEMNFMYNPAYLESILLNFISNAIKYSHPNRNPLVSLNSYSEVGRIVLEIQDNGLGIDLKKNGKQLFGLNKTFHGNEDARGIGLFISKNQGEALGGKIQVQSEVGIGTTFKIFLA
jgi:signal transduction histidine kinase